jgi:DNA-binding IscR family transcriptional regulator
MLRILRRLEDARLVKETGGDWAGFVPGCDPDAITIEEIVSLIEGVRREMPEIHMDDHERAVIGELFARLGTCFTNALDHQTIGQLVLALYGERTPARAEDATQGA